jgi:hypothetical protein
MVKDDQENVQRPPVPLAAAGSRSGKLVREAAMVLGLLSVGVAVAFGYRWLRHMDAANATESEKPPEKPAAKPPDLFKRWPAGQKPEFVFLLTGEMHGYIQPCGCSFPQYGGLARRLNFIERELTARGWTVVPLDVGDIAQRSGPQTKPKYVASMRALQKMGYHAIGTGIHEFGVPLPDAVAIFGLNEGAPWHLAANLKDPMGNFALNLVKPSYITDKESPVKIGVVGIVGPSVINQVRDPAAQFEMTKEALPRASKALANSGAEMQVLLYQGTLEEAKALAKAYPQFSMILSLSKEEEPREDPVKEGNTLIINVGHKGRKVGVLGAYRNGKKFDFHYQLCSIGPEYDTPPEQPGNKIHEILEDYAKEVKNSNYLAQHARTKHTIQLDPKYSESKYVGSDKCKKCHEHAYNVWKNSPHATAYDKLVKATRPGLRQYDPECAVCHVTGLNYVSGFQNETATAHLQDNGCENCHGPASMHLKNTADTKLHALMNPYKTQPNENAVQRDRRMNALDQSCQKCHDIDNDVNWNIKKWDKIVHKTPPEVPPVPAKP